MSEDRYTTKEMLKLAEGKGHAPSVEHADKIKAAFRQCIADRRELAEWLLDFEANGFIVLDDEESSEQPTRRMLEDYTQQEAKE